MLNTIEIIQGRPKETSKLVEYVDHPELQHHGRVELLLENAELLLDCQSACARGDEQVLFKAMQACGFALNHPKQGRTIKTLQALHRRIRDELVNRNIGLIYEMRRRTRVAGIDVDDLMSEGQWTLYRAVVSFDPWRGFRFSTYACTSILRAFLMLSRRRQRQSEQINQLGEARLSLRTVMDDHNLETQQKLDRLQTTLSDNRAGLSPMERFIIERRLLHDPGVKPETLESIGDMFHLSKERIRQIQMSAIDKLRGALASDENPDSKVAACASSADTAAKRFGDDADAVGDRRESCLSKLTVEFVGTPCQYGMGGARETGMERRKAG